MQSAFLKAFPRSPPTNTSHVFHFTFHFSDYYGPFPDRISCFFFTFLKAIYHLRRPGLTLFHSRFPLYLPLLFVYKIACIQQAKKLHYIDPLVSTVFFQSLNYLRRPGLGLRIMMSFHPLSRYLLFILLI